LGDLRRVAGMRFNFDSDQPTLLDIEVGQAADEVNSSKKMGEDAYKCRLCTNVLRRYGYFM
jgi:hypothetical protein